MTGPTHRQYSVCFAYLTLMILYSLDLSNINYYLALPIILMTAKAGALFPDVDHHWEAVKEKTITNKIINTIIHVTGGKHRSWQTHSIDICLAFCALACWLPNHLYELKYINVTNKEVLYIILVGFASGWVSHMLSDMLTSAGVRLVCWSKFKVKLVPKKIGGLRFNTGQAWEAFNYRCMKMINIVLGIACLLYPLVLNGTLEKLLNTIGLEV